MKKKVLSSTLALSMALGAFATLGTSRTYADEQKIQYNQEFQTPSYIGEEWKAPEGLDKKETVFEYLKSKKDMFKLAGNIEKHFEVVSEEKDAEAETTHVKLIEKHNGVSVYGSDQTVTLDKDNNVKAFFGQVIPNLENKNIPSSASISEDEAVNIAKAGIEKEIGKVDNYDGIKKDLYVYEKDGQYYLSYLVKASTSNPAPGYWHYFVDATNGNVIEKYNAIDHITGFGYGVSGNRTMFEMSRNEKTGAFHLFDGTRGQGVHTFDAKNMNPYLFDLLSQWFGYTGYEVESKNKFFEDKAAVDAHANAAKVYDYYKKTFNRNSYDNEGAKLISTVHVGKNWDNAGWNGIQMMYGDGDGKEFIPFSAGLDVIAHELTHAVTEYSANLEYRNESGALNESLSDIMGAMVDRDDWDMGEDIYAPEMRGTVLRSLSNPASIPNPLKPSEGYPDHYSKRYKGTIDNGGVHINSSINNKAAHLVSEGGTHYDVTVNGVGREATEKIYYRALTKYLTANSNFSMMRQAAIQAATDLYGQNSKEVQAVKKAYDAVGVK
ncbi:MULTISPECIES: M4 family metallopeptidase [unclassified Bacillus (in: firmicutes)]|uniref:M4 family metallopeptidase n=1 Tax=unclassified Bacillus (in: firmicutes) TaxID=185979 RepID=UPI0008F0DEBF|nr:MULTISPECIES: M4 family metallopeptidase [unclassified Bacillus (in: firmicutes)]SFJ16179.1 neutral peptidase B. Metallo peptidase. MEROPS family M04 [Bacillus sp. 71mf]SFT08730.1 neutral peptidase B. Metallo peptidase. MEROPS family M04 [Bacillus sp. 103mf]